MYLMQVNMKLIIVVLRAGYEPATYGYTACNPEGLYSDCFTYITEMGLCIVMN